MGRRLFIGNLSYNVSGDKLQDVFADFGTVVKATVITDRETGQSRGFGFVEYSTDEAAAIAIEAMNEAELDGRRLTVNEAREKDRSQRRDFSSNHPDNGGNGGYRDQQGGGDGGGKRKKRRRGGRQDHDSGQRDW